MRRIELVTAGAPAPRDGADTAQCGAVVAEYADAYYRGRHRLRAAESFVYTTIGATKQAVAAQDRVLLLYPGQHAADWAVLQMRSACLTRDGDIAEAMRYATEPLDAARPSSRWPPRRSRV